MRLNKIRYHGVVCCLLSVTALAIWPALQGPLILDDFPNLAPLLGHGEVDSYHVIFGNRSGPLGRSVSMLTFAINHWFSGNIVPFDLKLTNLVIHLANGLLLYGLILCLLKRVYPDNTKATLAVIVVACWLLNPVNTGTVPYAIQRMALLSTFFVFLGCLSYTQARICQSSRRKLSTLFYLIAFLCWPLASLSKENGVLLPLFLLVIEVCFFDDLWGRLSRLSRRQKVLLSVSIVMLTALLLIFLNSTGYMNYEGRNFSLAERLYTQPRVLLDYVWKTLLPSGVDVGLYHDDFGISKSPWSVPSFLSSLVLLAAVTTSLLMLKSYKNRHLVFGVLMFFSGHLIESTVFPLEMYFEHRNYLPSAGLLLSLVLIVNRFMEGRAVRKVMPVAILSYLAVLGYLSYEKSKIWASREAIIVNTYQKHPMSVRASLDMSALLTQRGDLRGSLFVNSQIPLLDRLETFRARIQRFFIYCELGSRIPESEYEQLRNSVSLYRPIEISTALGYFLESYERRNCNFINVKRVADSLSIWVDNQIEQEGVSATRTWSIEYYIVELLFASGYDDAAMNRLKGSANAGNIKARYYLEEFEGNQ